MNFIRKHLTPLTLLALLTVIFGTIYLVNQQSLRMSANDPQTQLAEDAANKLDYDATPASLLIDKVDARVSLSPFVIIYDKKGRTIASSAYIGPIPIKDIPFDVLKKSDKGSNAVTWQPDPNVRLAAVAVSAHDYYVVSARSLREVDKRESTLFWLTSLGWLLSVLITSKLYLLLKPNETVTES